MAQRKADRAYRKASRPLPLRHPILSGLGVIVVIAIIATAASAHKGTTTPPATNSGTSTTTGSTTTTAPPTTPASPTYTVAEQNAIDAARNYLQLGSGFSRVGLIQQLSSKAGDGFGVAVATFAVNHISVNWKAQAVEAAKNYLQLGSGFSRAILIQQLSSKAGDQFTLAQAKYAANHVGL